jgi:predicted transposase YdaD
MQLGVVDVALQQGQTQMQAQIQHRCRSQNLVGIKVLYDWVAATAAWQQHVGAVGRLQQQVQAAA